MNSDYVLLSELAQEFGLDTSNARKYVLKSGFQFIKLRGGSGNGYQKVLALSIADAERVRAIRKASGFNNTELVQLANGYFYVVQVVPDLDQRRVKLGYAADVDNRMTAYRTLSPTVALVKAWPCKPSWERAAMDSLTRIECEQIGVEVYQCENIDSLISRGNEFFGLMPML